MPLDSLCPACASSRMSVFFELGGVPIHSMQLLSDQEEARQYPRGDIALGFCAGCGFISNLAFEPARMRYSPSYESSQAFSPRFNAYARELAVRLIERYGLRRKDVLEVGCGRGDFLALLCELGNNRGIGIDPAADVGQGNGQRTAQITFIQDVYSERYAQYQADLVLCRHTLEHIWDVGDFLATVRRTIGDRRETAIFFEVPDTTRILREVAFWDIYYEHCSYFTAGSLARLFAARGFEAIEVSLAFDDQYLLLEALPGNGTRAPQVSNRDDLQELTQDVAFFVASYPAKLQAWRESLQRIAERGQRCIVWGGGSKAVAFLNILGVQDEVEFVVDINPLKQDKYVAGTGHKIVGPEFLRNHGPDVILVMNPIYCAEIGELVRGMGIDAELAAV